MIVRRITNTHLQLRGQRLRWQRQDGHEAQGADLLVHVACEQHALAALARLLQHLEPRGEHAAQHAVLGQDLLCAGMPSDHADPVTRLVTHDGVDAL